MLYCLTRFAKSNYVLRIYILFACLYLMYFLSRLAKHLYARNYFLIKFYLRYTIVRSVLPILGMNLVSAYPQVRKFSKDNLGDISMVYLGLLHARRCSRGL